MNIILDSNTDRMWFLIGTVFITVALLFMVIDDVPGLFSSITHVITTAGVSDDEVEAGSEGPYIAPIDRVDLYNGDFIENIGYESNNISIRPYHRGYVTPVEPGATYHITREHMANNRFTVGFSKSNPLGNPIAYNVSSEWDRAKEMRVEVPVGMSYMLIHLNEGTIDNSKLPTLEIYKVRNAG